ncbi:hypothetical protein KGF56_000814 [Candida oxycetoniae]|uniref:AB hydrolase-1 domain-containing protein n=1 Tax=Candida oxycetoniae TaxID=497107 RepID=A0AAI9T044_9ASCO|nr:uncharacterized protein KGF56_000814 [Candida oxycetoniae]KAI3406333.1 hypothetical protein KGF56_000814 [Candida oxycetoniae]
MIGSGFFKSKVENYFPKTPIRFNKRLVKEGDAATATTATTATTTNTTTTTTTTESTTIPELIKSKIKEFEKDYTFYVNPLLSSGHTQTAYTALNKFESRNLVYYKRQIITIEDKTYTLPNGTKLKYDQWKGESTVALDYAMKTPVTPDPDHLRFRPSSQQEELPPRTEFKNPEEELIENTDDKPLLIVLHGLSGGSFEAYIRAVLEKIIEDPYDFDAVVLNSRGCAHHTITSPQLYNGLWTNDVRYLMNEFVTKKWPKKRIYMMGFSLGGAILANYLGQEASAVSPQIKGACMFGTPWDFPDGAHHLRASIIGHNVYSPTMCANLLKLLNKHGILTENEFVKQYRDDPSKYNVKFLKDFDNFFTSRLFGLNSADEYYRLASPVQRLLKVRVPTLIISSVDDPVTGSRSLPYSESELNPYVTMVTTTVGGHLGWFTWNGERWYTIPVCKFLKELDQLDVDKSSITKDDLPLDISQSWKYDRLVNGMLDASTTEQSEIVEHTD